MGNCTALATEGTHWNFCPNVGVAYFWAVMFAFLTIAHIAQAIIYRKAYSIVIIISAALQTSVFIFRILSIYQPTKEIWYALWFVIILVAPIWTNAYVYMVMGRMVYNFLPDGNLFNVQARRFGLYFVLLDVVAFLVQVYGASSASGDDISQSQILRGIHIYMGGVGFQQFFIFVFVYIAIRFQRRVVKESPVDHQIRGLRLLYTLYAALGLITVRIIFRLIEYSKGVDSSIPNHEWTMYIFDTTPMWIAIVIFNVVHPGRMMPGKESNLPSRKEYKREKKATKAAKKAGKDLSGGDQTYEMLNAMEGQGSSGRPSMENLRSPSPMPASYAPNQPRDYLPYGSGQTQF